MLMNPRHPYTIGQPGPELEPPNRRSTAPPKPKTETKNGTNPCRRSVRRASLLPGFALAQSMRVFYAERKCMDTNPATGQTDKPPKLSAGAYVLCGWPLLLVAIGGAIGGGLGGAAFGVNLKIYKSNLPTAAKIVLNLFTGFAAIGLWFAIAAALLAARK